MPLLLLGRFIARSLPLLLVRILPTRPTWTSRPSRPPRMIKQPQPPPLQLIPIPLINILIRIRLDRGDLLFLTLHIFLGPLQPQRALLQLNLDHIRHSAAQPPAILLARFPRPAGRQNVP